MRSPVSMLRLAATRPLPGQRSAVQRVVEGYRGDFASRVALRALRTRAMWVRHMGRSLTPSGRWAGARRRRRGAAALEGAFALVFSWGGAFRF